MQINPFAVPGPAPAAPAVAPDRWGAADIVDPEAGFHGGSPFADALAALADAIDGVLQARGVPEDALDIDVPSSIPAPVPAVVLPDIAQPELLPGWAVVPPIAQIAAVEEVVEEAEADALGPAEDSAVAAVVRTAPPEGALAVPVGLTAPAIAEASGAAPLVDVASAGETMAEPARPPRPIDAERAHGPVAVTVAPALQPALADHRSSPQGPMTSSGRHEADVVSAPLRAPVLGGDPASARASGPAVDVVEPISAPITTASDSEAASRSDPESHSRETNDRSDNPLLRSRPAEAAKTIASTRPETAEVERDAPNGVGSVIREAAHRDAAVQPSPYARVPMAHEAAPAVTPAVLRIDQPAPSAGQPFLRPAAAPALMHARAAVLAAEQSSTALPGETTSQIVQHLRLLVSRTGGEAQIRLEPRHFGDMTVTLRVERKQVVARVEADTPVVREWIQSNQAVLRNSLAEHQLTLDRIEIAEPGESREPADRRRDQHAPDRQPRPRSRRAQTSGRFEVVA
jgi:flagellar hook-length control protein FliK